MEGTDRLDLSLSTCAIRCAPIQSTQFNVAYVCCVCSLDILIDSISQLSFPNVGTCKTFLHLLLILQNTSCRRNAALFRILNAKYSSLIRFSYWTYTMAAVWMKLFPDADTLYMLFPRGFTTTDGGAKVGGIQASDTVQAHFGNRLSEVSCTTPSSSGSSSWELVSAGVWSTSSDSMQ